MGDFRRTFCVPRPWIILSIGTAAMFSDPLALGWKNPVGSGVFGFLANPTFAFYFIEGFNPTTHHSHAALFGVDGVLALAVVFSVAASVYRRGIDVDQGTLKLNFYCEGPREALRRCAGMRFYNARIIELGERPSARPGFNQRLNQ